MPEGRWSGDNRTVDKIISEEKKSSIRRVFPGDYLDKKPDRIYKDAEDKKISSKQRKKAITARKLLDSIEYDD